MICIATEIIVISDDCSDGSYQRSDIHYKTKKEESKQDVKYKKIFLNSCSICDYMINTVINEVALGKKNKHIFMVFSNDIFSRSKDYSNKTIRYFIKKQKKNEDEFFIYSKNLASLILGAYLGMIPKINRRFYNGKQI